MKKKKYLKKENKKFELLQYRCQKLLIFDPLALRCRKPLDTATAEQAIVFFHILSLHYLDACISSLRNLRKEQIGTVFGRRRVIVGTKIGQMFDHPCL